MSWLTRLLRGPDAPVLTASPDAPSAPTGAATATLGGPSAGARDHGPGLTGEQLLARVEAIPLTKFREGYDVHQVDALAVRIAAALDGADEAFRPEDVLDARFAPTKFREGYDQSAVDDLLDEVVVALRTRD
ncbi:hypothetical protein Cpa01nite_18390 [Cellulomonas pakistanensis]|uniref:DivIVA domain-containing protein n=1 Tax=Cellulomonas pakistanensis TaxID=992287 RepID=A0A919U2U7_9CELL|nr:hypothetical protein Cpa01nite_18390 [Cellulomonas pakistanensis]